MLRAELGAFLDYAFVEQIRAPAVRRHAIVEVILPHPFQRDVVAESPFEIQREHLAFDGIDPADAVEAAKRGALEFLSQAVRSLVAPAAAVVVREAERSTVEDVVADVEEAEADFVDPGGACVVLVLIRGRHAGRIGKNEIFGEEFHAVFPVVGVIRSTSGRLRLRTRVWFPMSIQIIAGA
jgi:hypothetical protein